MPEKNARMKLPKLLYVYKDSEYLVANENETAAASLEEERYVGVYQLTKIIKITAKAHVEKV